MSYFKGKKVLITGASSGIGEALAIDLNLKGAIVIMCARNFEALLRVQDKFYNNIPSFVRRYDVTDFESTNELIEDIVEDCGGIDILINNAGISQRSLAKDTSFEDEKKIIDVNLLGVLAITKACLPYILEARGQIVVINSVMGKINTKYRSAYAASKHALTGYFDSLRLEVEDEGVNVCMIFPGFIATNITRNAVGSTEEIIETSQNNKGMKPDEFAMRATYAIQRKAKQKYIGGFKEGFAMWFKKMAPRLFDKFIKHQKVT